MVVLDLVSTRQKALDDFYAVVPSSVSRSHMHRISPFIRDPYYLTHPIQQVSPARHLHDIRRHHDRVLSHIAGQGTQSFESLSRVPSSSLHDKAIGITHFAFDRAGSLLAVSSGSGVVSIYDVDELQLSFRNKTTSSITPVLKLETGRSVASATFLSSKGGNDSDEDCLAVAFSFSCQVRIYRLSVCLSVGSTSPDSFLSLEVSGRGRDGGHMCLLAYSPLAQISSHTAATAANSRAGMGMLNLNNQSRQPNKNHTTTTTATSAPSGPRPVRLVAGGDLGWLRSWTVSRTGQLTAHPPSPDWNFPVDAPAAPLLSLTLVSDAFLCVVSGKSISLLDPSRLSPPTLAAHPQPIVMRKRELAGMGVGGGGVVAGACLQDRVVVGYEGGGIRVFCLPDFTPLQTFQPSPSLRSASSQLPVMPASLSSSGEVMVTTREGLRDILFAGNRAAGDSGGSGVGAGFAFALTSFPLGRGGGPLMFSVRAGKLQSPMPLSTLSSVASHPPLNPATSYIRSASFTLTLPPRLPLLSALPGDCRLVLGGDPSQYLCAAVLAASAPAHSHRLLVQLEGEAAYTGIYSVRSIVGTTVHTEEPWGGPQIEGGRPFARLRVQLLPHPPSSPSQPLSSSLSSSSSSAVVYPPLPPSSASSSSLSQQSNTTVEGVSGLTALCAHPSLPLVVMGDGGERVWLAPLVRIGGQEVEEVESVGVPAQRMRVIRSLPLSPPVPAATRTMRAASDGCDGAVGEMEKIVDAAAFYDDNIADVPLESHQTEDEIECREGLPGPCATSPTTLSLDYYGSDDEVGEGNDDNDTVEGKGDADAVIAIESQTPSIPQLGTLPPACPAVRATAQAHLIDIFSERNKENHHSDPCGKRPVNHVKDNSKDLKKSRTDTGSTVGSSSAKVSSIRTKQTNSGPGSKQTSLSIFFQPK